LLIHNKPELFTDSFRKVVAASLENQKQLLKIGDIEPKTFYRAESQLKIFGQKLSKVMSKTPVERRKLPMALTLVSF
jgi:hypothetical protein